MKRKILVLSFCFLISFFKVFSQTQKIHNHNTSIYKDWESKTHIASKKDTIVQKKFGLLIEAGISAPLFIDKIFPLKNTVTLAPSFYKITFITSKKITFSFNYKSFSKQFDRNDRINGHIDFIKYHAFDFSCGYTLLPKCSFFTFMPYLSLSARPSGTESIFLGYRNHSLKYEPVFNYYSYKGLGFGLGFNSFLLKII